MEIKILGTGCPKCQTLEKITSEVISENNFDIKISKVEDILQIMSFGVMTTPAVIMNKKVLISGRVPSKNEIKKLIEKHIND